MAMTAYGYQANTWLDNVDGRYTYQGNSGNKPPRKKKKAPTTLDSIADELKEQNTDQQQTQQQQTLTALATLIQNTSKREATQADSHRVNHESPGLRMQGSGAYDMETEQLEANLGNVETEGYTGTNKKTNWGNVATGVVGGVGAGLASAKTHEGNPYDTDSYKPSGIGQTDLSGMASYEHLKHRKKKGKANEFDYQMTDFWQGTFGGGTSGYASGGWVGMLAGALTGGITTVVKGEKARRDWRNYIRDQEFYAKQEWVNQSRALAIEGSQSGAYLSDYKGLSSLVVDAEKKKLDDELRRRREEAGMKDLNTNYYV